MYFIFASNTCMIHEIIFSGLLVYNGEQSTGSGDFMGVAMRDGRVEFKFDVGSGPAVITSDPVQLNEWHTIRVKRNNRDGQFCFLI